MALTGQLSDMSLAELIEFFCNQRKTGRLKIDYQRGHSVFFIKEGELVDAKVGSLSGVEAIYFSLTLPNAAFDFSPDVLPTRRTIEESWTQVVLEGLRRLDEGLSPTEAEAFGAWTPNESDMALFMDQVERLGDDSDRMKASAKAANEKAASAKAKSEKVTSEAKAPFPMMVDSATAGSGGGGRRKWMVMGTVAGVALLCAAAAIPLSGAFNSKPPAPAPVVVSAPQTAAPAGDEATNNAAANDAPVDSAATAITEASAAESAAAESAAADAARRARDTARERKDRERRAEEQAKLNDGAPLSADKPATPAATPAVAAIASGPKSVRVSVTYDEQGRVTQASVAGASPGAEAYGGTAVRAARGKHFPAGKAGSTVVTIPVN